MNYTIERVTNKNKHYLPRKKDPFQIIGKAIPILNERKWEVQEELYESWQEKTYPDEQYDSKAYVDSKNQVAFLLMVEGKCVGSIRASICWNGYARVDDLAIDKDYRFLGLGKALMDAACNWAKSLQLPGMTLETQDNNLIAVRFYLKYGFILGGIDTKVYNHSKYQEETAFYFYYDF